MAERVDIVIVGGGISGVSLAARLAPHAGVAVLEAAEHLGTQATGRSAALLVEAYGPPEIRGLTGMSRGFFETPPDGFADAPLARRRGALIYARGGDVQRLKAEFDLALRTTGVVWMRAPDILTLCPILRPGAAEAGFLEPNVLDLETDLLLQGFARIVRASGSKIVTGAAVRGISRSSRGWELEAGEMTWSSRFIVNAAGAWADEIAALAGVARRGLTPMRRTAATIRVPDDIGAQLARMPFVAPVDESFYFKPDAGAIMVSLSEETPSAPCDAHADDIDVATALERFHAETIVPRARPEANWAGLRTFAPDRLPVVGFDPRAPGFFWYAGQGGYGIQTSPALSTLASKLVLGAALTPAEVEIATGLRTERLAAAA